MPVLFGTKLMMNHFPSMGCSILGSQTLIATLITRCIEEIHAPNLTDMEI